LMGDWMVTFEGSKFRESRRSQSVDTTTTAGKRFPVLFVSKWPGRLVLRLRLLFRLGDSQNYTWACVHD